MINLPNKQTMIHFVTEFLLFSGIIFFFSQRYNKLQNQIKKLYNQVEAQDQILHVHDKMLKQILENEKIQNSLNSILPTKSHQTNNDTNNDTSHNNISISQNNLPLSKNLEKIEEIEEIVSDTESELDNEIEEELKELEISKKKDL